MEFIDDDKFDHHCEINRDILKPKNHIDGTVHISAKLLIFNEYYTGGIKNKFPDAHDLIFNDIANYVSSYHIYDDDETFAINRENETINVVTNFDETFKTIKSVNKFINDTRLFMHGYEDGSADGYLCGDAVVYVEPPFTKDNIDDMSDDEHDKYVYEIAFENMTFELKDGDNTVLSIRNDDYWSHQ